MSPEALARLREHVGYVFKDGELPESERLAHDLRALLDAYDTARAERDEALDALALFADSGHWSWEYRWTADTVPPFEIAGAILAKAGRR